MRPGKAASATGARAARGGAAAPLRGEIFGAPPSGRRFTGASISWATFRDGQIGEYSVLPDRLGILRQLTPETQAA
jgi:predicted ester cyclase